MGLTPQGYSPTTVSEEVDDLSAKVLAAVDPGLDLSPDQPLGQLIAAMAEKTAELTELGATVYNALNPAAAEGALLVNVCAISGTKPQVATYSKVAATLTTTATVPAGSVCAVAGQPANTWVSLTDAVPDGGHHATVLFRSSQPGIFKANAGTLTVINTPVIGWTAVTNVGDSLDGLAADTDGTLRAKREAELAGEGSGDIDAIRAAVLKVPGVQTVFADNNTTLLYDSLNTPPKAFQIIVWDGAVPAADDDAIAQAICNNTPSGILAAGSTWGIAIDVLGNRQFVQFSRATQKRLYVLCTTTPSTLTTDQTNAVKAAIKGWADTYFTLGANIIARSFSAAALEPVATADATPVRPAYAPFITDVPTFAFDFSASPVNTGNLTLTAMQIATLATTDILVNGV